MPSRAYTTTSHVAVRSMPDHDTLFEAQYLYLTTTGRKTGQPRQIEIWFVTSGTTRMCMFVSAIGNLTPRPGFSTENATAMPG